MPRLHSCAPITTLVLAFAMLSLSALCAQEVARDHVRVTYSGIDRPHAEAIARTVEAARRVAVEDYGFEMPPVIHVRVIADSRKRVRLFNDGHDTFSLSLRSENDLRPPASSGVFHLYGLCHEVAHLAMYRPIQQRGWLTAAGAEGWAHYLGSHIVDTVYEQEGGDLWADPYDYSEDGTKRLQRQFEQAANRSTVKGAKLWGEFVDIVGKERVAAIFDAWGRAGIDSAGPIPTLQKAIPTDVDPAGLDDWWARARTVLFFRQPKSGYAARTVKRTELTGQPLNLHHDDDKAVGKKSIAGGGHGVRFEVVDNSFFLTSVSVFGSRYGASRAPNEDFHLWLCDEEFRSFAEFSFPYSTFQHGRPEWVKLSVKPTSVPQRFNVVVGFNPTGRKGVFVSHDSKADGASFTGLPGRKPRPFTVGDWMIRVETDQLKSANAIKD